MKLLPAHVPPSRPGPWAWPLTLVAAMLMSAGAVRIYDTRTLANNTHEQLHAAAASADETAARRAMGKLYMQADETVATLVLRARGTGPAADAARLSLEHLRCRLKD